MEKLQINAHAAEICKILQHHGFQAYIVGGCVRDLILGQIPKDWDITTNAKPEEVMSIFPITYPTGIDHGTITVSMGQGTENHFEVTTFRVEGKYLDGRRPEEVSFVNSVEEDLSRRDLTINAIAYNPITNELKDPFNGQLDLQNKTIKAVGDPNLRFQEDGLRIMRAARFAARFGYTIEENTLQGMKNNLETLKKVSKERIKDELCKTIMSANPGLGLHILSVTGALQIASPALKFEIKKDTQFKGDLETRLTCLYLHLSIDKIENELEYLKFSNKEIKQIMFLYELMGHYYKYSNKIQTIDDYKNIISIIKNRVENWEHNVEQYCIIGDLSNLPIREKLNQYKDICVWRRSEMLIDGNDLIALDIKPGPEIKKLLDKCYQEILKNPSNNSKDILLNLVKSLAIK